MEYRDGVHSKYDGARNAAGIVSWMKKRVNPNAKELTTCDDIKKEIETNKRTLLFLGDATESSYPVFQDLMLNPSLDDKITFARTTDHSCLKETFGVDA